MSFGGRFGVVLCRLGVGSFPPRKSQPYSPPCVTHFHPRKNFFCAKFPNPPFASFGNRPSEIESPLSTHFQCALFNSQFSIFAPHASIRSAPRTPRKKNVRNEPNSITTYLHTTTYDIYAMPFWQEHSYPPLGQSGPSAAPCKPRNQQSILHHPKCPKMPDRRLASLISRFDFHTGSSYSANHYGSFALDHHCHSFRGGICPGESDGGGHGPAEAAQSRKKCRLRMRRADHRLQL